ECSQVGGRKILDIERLRRGAREEHHNPQDCFDTGGKHRVNPSSKDASELGLSPEAEVDGSEKNQRDYCTHDQQEDWASHKKALRDRSRAVHLLLTLFGSQLRHPLLSFWAERDLVLAHLAHAHFAVHGPVEGKAENDVNNERQPPALIAAFDVFEDLRRRRK